MNSKPGLSGLFLCTFPSELSFNHGFNLLLRFKLVYLNNPKCIWLVEKRQKRLQRIFLNF